MMSCYSNECSDKAAPLTPMTCFDDQLTPGVNVCLLNFINQLKFLNSPKNNFIGNAEITTVVIFVKDFFLTVIAFIDRNAQFKHNK